MAKPHLNRIDNSTLDDHWYLAEEDCCFFLGEYVPYVGPGYSEVNQLVYNFKKSPERKNRPEYNYKKEAIRRIAQMFQESLPIEWLMTLTLVPIPPSKTKNDPLHDTRILDMLYMLQTRIGLKLDIRELIIQTESTPASHESDERPSPKELMGNWLINNEVAEPRPKKIALFDDLITTGAHFKAAQTIIKKRYDGVFVGGIFFARRKIQRN